MFLSDKEASDGGRISQLFAKRFNSIYSPPFTSLSCRYNSSALIDNFYITLKLLSSTIADYKDNLHAGPNDILSYFIKGVGANHEILQNVLKLW